MSTEVKKRKKKKNKLVLDKRRSSLFKTNIPDSRLIMNSVYLNNITTVTKFTITNTSKHKIRIHLKSELVELTFQLTNENFGQQEGDSNQLLNTFNLINQIVLDPYESKDVFVGFKPSDIYKRGSSYLYFTVTGYIVLTAEIVSNNAKTSKHDQQYIEFSANVCKSFLETDVTDLDFGDCTIGEKYVKDFTIRNRSEIPLTFMLVRKKVGADVDFTNYETGEIIHEKTVIQGHSHMRVSVTLLPKTAGPIEFPILVENVNDDSNTSIVNVHGEVVQDETEAIIIRDEHGRKVRTLDFGDCYTGESISRLLTIKNLTKEKMDVILSTKLGSISFKLHMEEDEVVAEPIKIEQGENQEESPLESSLNRSIVEQHDTEDVLLNPGEEKTIEIWYKPEPEEEEDETKLSTRRFRISFICRDVNNRDKKAFTTSIQCTARVCTSIVEVLQKELNFGDCTIGSFSYGTVQVMNKSELPTEIFVDFTSKVVTCEVSRALLAPKQTIRLKFRVSPRKINPNYRKQITIINAHNKDNYNTFMIRSNNIDKNMLTFHALFYDVITQTQHNFAKNIDFKTVVANDTSLKTFVIKNITKKALRVQLTVSSPEEIRLYKPQLESSLGSFFLRKSREDFLASIEEHTSQMKLGKSRTSEKSPDPNILGFRWPSESKQTKEDFENFLKALRRAYERPLQLPTTGDAESEEKYVRYTIELKKSLMKAIGEGLLVPCKEVVVDPESESTIYVVFKPLSRHRPNLSATLKKIEESLFISLLEFDRTITKSFSEKNIPSRELSIQANVCLSKMEITQKHINFGYILNTEERKKSLSINNTSEVPLLYKIKKTGSIASGDLVLDSGRVGIVRPYGTKEIQMLFKPSLSGQFREQITIHNVQDVTDTNVITVKAFIKQQERFLVKPTELKFNDVLVQKRSISQAIALTNATKGRRIFEIRIEHTFKFCNLDYEFVLEETNTPSAEVEKLEAELELCERKIMINTRKKKMDKVQKYQKRAEEIRKLLHLDFESVTSDDITSDDGKDDRAKSKKFKKLDNGIRFAVPAQGTQLIHIQIKPIPIKAPENLIEVGSGILSIFERKNTDFQRKVSFDMTVHYNTEEYDKHLQEKLPLHIPKIDTLDIPKISHSRRRESFNESKAETLIIQPTEIDLGNINLGEISHCRLFIQCVNEESGFVVLAPYRLGITSDNIESCTPMKFKFSKQNASIAVGETFTLDIYCEPQSTGPQRHNIVIQNLKTKKQHLITVLCNPQRKPPIELVENELNFGFVYVEKEREFAKSVPLTIKNKEDEEFTLQVSSNLGSQLKIFKDEKLEEQIETTLLQPKENVVLYIALKPFLTPHEYETGRCRTLVGGIRLKVFAKSSKILLFEKIVKIRGIVGRSILQVSKKMVDFGCAHTLCRTYSSTITLTNKNMCLPLEFEILTDENTSVNITRGKLDGYQTKNGVSHQNIKITFTPSRFGLNFGKIVIKNKQNQEAIEVTTRVFVNDSSKTPLLETNLLRHSSGMDLLKLNPVFLAEKDGQLINAGNEITSFKIKNTTNRLVKVQMYSDLKLQVIIDNAKVLDKDHPSSSLFGELYSFCGKAFEIKVGEEARVHVKLLHWNTLDEEELANIYQYKNAIKQGTLLISNFNNHESTPQIMRMVTVEVSLCIPRCQLLYPKVELGKFGHTNQWQNLVFECGVRNMSECPLYIKAEAEADVQMMNSGYLLVPPNKTVSLQGMLLADRFMNQPARPIHKTVRITNRFNPSNTLTFSVFAELTNRIWNFSSLHQDSTLVLPILELPLPIPSPPCEECFSVVNTSDEEVEANFQVIPSEQIKDFLNLEVLDFSENKPLKYQNMAPGDIVGIRVRCLPQPNSRLPKHLFDYLIHNDKPGKRIQFGKILMESQNQPTEVITIEGMLKQNPTFSLSAKRLRFRSDILHEKILMNTFSIKNVDTQLPLEFVVEPKVPKDSNLHISVEPSKGKVAGGESMEISVYQTLYSLDRIYEISLEVYDVNHPFIRETIIVEKGIETPVLKEFPKTPIKSPDHFEFSDKNDETLPLFTLKNLRSISEETGRYEIDMGQQNFESESVEWDFTIENISKYPVDFKIRPIDESYANQWLKISKTEGTLSEKFDTQVITISFNTKQLATYSTYLVVENCNNPSDVKTIRVSMEVVASGSQSGKEYFQVFAGGGSLMEKSRVIELGQVFLGDLVRHAYIDIANISSIPLEFQLTHNLTESDSSELHFSLSLTSIKSFHSLRVEANSKSRVYLLFLPNANDELANKDHEQQVEIFVKCRLVKDYQETIILKALCSPPHMHVSTKEIMFIGNNTDSTIKITPPSSTIILENLFNDDLRYSLRNDTNFFEVITPQQREIPKKGKHKLIVKPILSKLAESKFLIKGKFVEEHFTIYNKKNLKEKIWVSVKFSMRYLRQFYTTPGPKSAYAFSNLEERIVKFLREFNSLYKKYEKEKEEEDILNFYAKLFKRKPFSRLYFELNYITDELVYYGLMGKAGQAFFDLALLLYSVLYNHEIFKNVSKIEGEKPRIISKWQGQLAHFLSYFTMMDHEDIETLLNLYNRNKRIVK